jgi:hypothetical protein
MRVIVQETRLTTTTFSILAVNSIRIRSPGMCFESSYRGAGGKSGHRNVRGWGSR